MKLKDQASAPIRRLVKRVVILVVLLALQFWLWPFVRSMALRWNDIRTRSEQLSELEARLVAIEAAYDAQQVALDQVMLAAPTRAEIPRLIERFERLAVERGVVVQVQNVTEAAPDESNEAPGGEVAVPATGADLPKPLQMSLRIIGSAPALLGYFDALEQLAEITQVTSWVINPLAAPVATPSPDNPILAAPQYELNLTVLFYLTQ